MDKRLLAAEQLRYALQLFASTLAEDKAMQIASVYPVWQTDTAYKKDDIISYGTNAVGDPQLYRVVQNHKSQSDWLPNTTESLYTAFGLDSSGNPLWAQPSGAHDAYKKGDVVNYNGKLYTSLIDGNVWAPDVYPAGWSEGGTVGPQPEPEPEPGPTTYPEWKQPTGGHDAYKKGDIVNYKGTLYKSLIDSNTWSPEAYPAGWEVYTAG